MSTFQVTTSEIRQGIFAITGKEAHHLTHVLRIAPGEHLQLADGEGNLFEGVVVELKGGVTIQVTKSLPSPPLPFPIHLYLALLKSEKMETVVQKAVELNIETVHFMSAARSIRQELSPAKWGRLQKIADAAVKQCGRSKPLMLLNSGDKTIDLINREADKKMTHIFFLESESGDRKPVRELFQSSALSPPFGLWIGPEGGWSPEEVQAARENNFPVASLGPLILRSDTAAIHAISSVLTLVF